MEHMNGKDTIGDELLKDSDCTNIMGQSLAALCRFNSDGSSGGRRWTDIITPISSVAVGFKGRGKGRKKLLVLL